MTQPTQRPTADPAALHAQALKHYAAGQRAETAALAREILRADPIHADAMFLLGVVELDQGRAEMALNHFRSAVEQQPDDARYLHALGEACRALNRPKEAAECFQAAVLRNPGMAAAHQALGLARQDMGDLPGAIASLRSAVAVQPDYARAHLNLGRALQNAGELEQAAASYRSALRHSPNYAIAHNNLGALLVTQNKLKDAATHLGKALALDPQYPEAHYNQGNLRQAQDDPAGAAASYAEALRLRPHYNNAQFQLGATLEALSRREEAQQVYENLLTRQPDHAEGWQRLSVLYMASNQWERAQPALEQATRLAKDPGTTLANAAYARAMVCDWSQREADNAQLWALAESRLAQGQPTGVPPFFAKVLDWPAARQLVVARAESHSLAAKAAVLAPRARQAHTRLRVGYLSGDFYDHAVSHLAQGLFALHDRAAFEVYAYSFGPNDGSAYRQRIEAQCEHFVEVRPLTNRQLAQRIRDDGIDILIDMMGYSGFTRFEVMAARPAPLQASWLAYPGSTGAAFIDYVVGDQWVTPAQAADQFSEKLLRLPHCYLITDQHQSVADIALTRAQFGLPRDGVVFVCWNNSYKFEPLIFGVWMRILAQVPGSVLWLKGGTARMMDNLRREAAARGVEPARLVFDSQNLVKPQHLARLKLADLFIDTHVYNAHTTAVDALWAGLPLLSCPGEGFPSRVGASLLHAVGLPELIAPDLAAYEARAVELARDPAQLAALRARLAQQRTRAPLFDTPRFVRDFERGLRAMWDLHQAGGKPRPIDL